MSMNSNNSEPAGALNPELAEKDARELQETYETALRGEDEEENWDNEGEVDGGIGDDDDNDRESAGLVGDDMMMDVDGPGLFHDTC